MSQDDITRNLNEVLSGKKTVSHLQLKNGMYFQTDVMLYNHNGLLEAIDDDHEEFFYPEDIVILEVI